MRESFHIYSANHYLTLQTHHLSNTKPSAANCEGRPIQEPLMFTFEDQDVKGQSPFEDQDMQIPDDTTAGQRGLPGIFPKV